jgi:hypothetical protein
MKTLADELIENSRQWEREARHNESMVEYHTEQAKACSERAAAARQRATAYAELAAKV